MRTASADVHVVVDDVADHLQDRRAQPVRARAADARARPRRRAARASAPSCSSRACPARAGGSRSGLRSSSPEHVVEVDAGPGSQHAGPGPVRAGDARGVAVRVQHGDVRRRARAARPRATQAPVSDPLGGLAPRDGTAEEALREPLLVQPLVEVPGPCALASAITSASSASPFGSSSGGGLAPALQQLQRVGDQDAARRRRCVGEHAPVPVGDLDRARARSPGTRRSPRGEQATALRTPTRRCARPARRRTDEPGPSCAIALERVSRGPGTGTRHPPSAAGPSGAYSSAVSG